jgi:hypothetical protein
MSQKEHASSKTALKGKEKALFFSPILEQLLERLPVRSRDIIAVRFGMQGAEPKTLEEIGHSYRITRERVRQVIGSALEFLSQESEHSSLVQISARIRSTLEEKSGIMKAEEFLCRLTPTGGKERGALLAFIECLSVIKEEKSTKERERAYMLKGFSLAEWEKVKESAKAILTEADQALDKDELFARFAEKNSAVSKQKFFDFLAVAKDVRQNVFGKWGLVGWSDIKPRGTREKAHLVLKMAGKPLHFREIAALIDSYGLQSSKKRQSHPQTVHNELIKDKRFVLVGRGVYALSEWGYKKGTVKEVLAEILARMDKPLSREEVLAEVLKVRQVKKSTVIINLNTFFDRVGKNAYTVKK